MLLLISLFTFLTTGGNVYPWNHPFVILAGMLFVVFASLFIHVEGRVKKPVLPLYLLLNFPTRNIMLTGFLGSMVNYIVSLKAMYPVSECGCVKRALIAFMLSR